MALKLLTRLSAALIIACLMFYFISPNYMYYIVMIPVVLISIATKRRIFVLLGFVTLLILVLFVVVTSLGVQEEIQNDIGFFYRVYQMIYPKLVGKSWSVALPLYFWYVLLISAMIILFFLAFSYFLRHGNYAKWLVEAFSFTIMTVLFLYTIISLFSMMTFNLYELLRTNTIALLIWEVLFVWLPFYAFVLILYCVIAYFFR